MLLGKDLNDLFLCFAYYREATPLSGKRNKVKALSLHLARLII